MYYDIDDILCEEQQVDIHLKADIYRGGQFDAEYQSLDINLEPGHKLRLPFWLGKTMFKLPGKTNETSLMNVPEVYCTEFLNALNSAPLIQNLRDHSNYFYEFANKIIALLYDVVESKKDDLKLSDVIKHTLVERAIHIQQKSQLSYIENVSQFMWLLTISETRIFNLGRDIAEDYRRWKDGSINKRKRAHMQKKLKS